MAIRDAGVQVYTLSLVRAVHVLSPELRDWPKRPDPDVQHVNISFSDTPFEFHT